MKNIIMNRTGCNEKRAAIIEADLKQLHESLRPLLNRWIDEGVDSDDTLYEGYSINSLKHGFGMRFTGAILTLDWLVKDPEAAKAALKSDAR